MVGLNMDSPVRDRVLKLIEEKERLESEIRDHTAVLESNNIGMDEPLVDDQGYPRNDIDVYKVRHARHQIICLQNDHKNHLKLIERGLEEVHAELLGSTRASSSHAATSCDFANSRVNGHTNGHVGNGHSRNDVPKEPFAIIMSVMEGSPAEMSGLRTNDRIIQFGSLTHANFDNIIQVHNIVKNSIGQPINVQVMREHSVVSIYLVPRPWAQSGLLGCHIQRIN